MTSLLETLNFVKTIGVGEIQSDEEMTVVPLIGDGRGTIAPPEALKFTQSISYGSMEYENNSDMPAIIPSNMMACGKNAQDHAMSGSGIVLADSSEIFVNACCIESSQGGHLGQKTDKDILPVGLRKELLDTSKRNLRAYNKLWNDIRSWLSDLSKVRKGDRAHLRDFFDQPDYKEALETFAAAFEPVDNQIGALILFAGVPVGLEIMPSTEHWSAYWKWLIRGCYGSQLIKLRETNKISRSVMILPEIPTDADADQVKEIMNKFLDNIKLNIAPILDKIQVSRQIDFETKGSMTTKLIRTESGGGDVIYQDSTPVYVSLVF